MNEHAATFDQYYETTDDPWGFRTRWYEQRKRALLCAALPRDHYDAAWEIGCSNGELAAALAPSCASLLATDGNEAAVRSAITRLAGQPHAAVQAMWVPEQWPERTFDLIVLSEMAYYLSEDSLAAFCEKLSTTLRPGGDFVACHWRPPIEGCAMDGDEVHRTLSSALPWKKTVHHLEKDFLLEVWSNRAQSVAEQEGLRRSASSSPSTTRKPCCRAAWPRWRERPAIPCSMARKSASSWSSMPAPTAPPRSHPSTEPRS